VVTALSQVERKKLLPLHTGYAVPSGHLNGLTNALGACPAGAKWERHGHGYCVDAHVADFLEDKRGGA
jgi:hypothetical protein